MGALRKPSCQKERSWKRLSFNRRLYQFRLIDHSLEGSKLSYDFDIIALSDDRAQTLSDLKEFFDGRKGYKQLKSQYEFLIGGGEDGFLVEIIDELDLSDIDTEDEEDSRTLAWVAVNFWRPSSYYVAAAKEMSALLETGKFVLFNPQEEVFYENQFPSLEFVNYMSKALGNSENHKQEN